MKCLLAVCLLLLCINATAEEAEPQLTSRLFHVQLEGVPCMMRWGATNTLAVGETLFGYVVTHIEDITASNQPPESTSETERRLVATLERGEQTLKVERGEAVDFVEYYATFASTQEVAAIRSAVGDTFVVENQFYKFLSVDMEHKTCTVVDLASGETLVVGKEKERLQLRP